MGCHGKTQVGATNLESRTHFPVCRSPPYRDRVAHHALELHLKAALSVAVAVWTPSNSTHSLPLVDQTRQTDELPYKLHI